MQIQSQLSESNQYEEHLLEVLRNAIYEQPFLYICVEKHYFHPEYVQEYLNAIEEQEHQNRQTAVRSLTTSVDTSAYTTSVTPASPLRENTHIATAIREIVEALYAKASRRYGRDNRVNKFAGKIHSEMADVYYVVDAIRTPN